MLPKTRHKYIKKILRYHLMKYIFIEIVIIVRYIYTLFEFNPFMIEFLFIRIIAITIIFFYIFLISMNYGSKNRNFIDNLIISNVAHIRSLKKHIDNI